MNTYFEAVKKDAKITEGRAELISTTETDRGVVVVWEHIIPSPESHGPREWKFQYVSIVGKYGVKNHLI